MEEEIIINHKQYDPITFLNDPDYFNNLLKVNNLDKMNDIEELEN